MRPNVRFTPLEKDTERRFINLIVAFRKSGDDEHANEAKQSLNELYDIVRKRTSKG